MDSLKKSLTQEQKDLFWKNGHMFISDLIPESFLKELQAATNDLVDVSRARTVSDSDFDLASGHSPDMPLCNRIKEPYRLHPTFMKLLHSEILLDIIESLIGENLYFEDMPLNMKPPGNKNAIEWHQDWAYMPYTNDDMVVALIYLCDCDEQNGAIKVVPGTHRRDRPISHHTNGRFCGAIDPTDPYVNWEDTVTAIGRAGGVSFHHGRTVHGSALNLTQNMRPVQAIGYCAGDAWPLINLNEGTQDALEKKLLRGQILPPRVEKVPFRLPYPPAEKGGSLFKIQEDVYGRSFK